MKHSYLQRLLAAFFLMPLFAFAQDDAIQLQAFEEGGDFQSVAPLVIEQTPFYGLSGYYNGVTFYRITGDEPVVVPREEITALPAGEMFAAVGRFNVLLVESQAALRFNVAQETFVVSGPKDVNWNARILRKDELAQESEALDALRYQHLWSPLAWLSRTVEWAVESVQSLTGLGWGWSIVVFSVLLKVLLLPLSLYAARLQASVGAIQSQLAPKLAEIKEKFDGEEAHKRIMAAHKDLGVSTFFSLKPLGALFLQVPVWIAVFNALGEMPQLVGQGFLWVNDLAYPDSIASLRGAIPFLGSSVSLLPVLMAGVTFASSLLLRDTQLTAPEKKRQTRNALLTALAFLLLFYPFPAAMVLYWTLSNGLQIIQQKLIKPA
ncbi:MAG: membrane protein insertase YidC [Halioglobus sp.]